MTKINCWKNALRNSQNWDKWSLENVQITVLFFLQARVKDSRFLIVWPMQDTSLRGLISGTSFVSIVNQAAWNISGRYHQLAEFTVFSSSAFMCFLYQLGWQTNVDEAVTVPAHFAFIGSRRISGHQADYWRSHRSTQDHRSHSRILGINIKHITLTIHTPGTDI